MSSRATDKLEARRATVFVTAPSISAGPRIKPHLNRSQFFHDAFRPFYLGGAFFAAIAVPLWLGMWYHNYFTPSLPSLYWHAHEMVFGFAGAIIIGFLFTAARNWTGLPLPAGIPLGLLVSLWLVSRVGMFFAYGPALAVVDSLLLLIVAGVLARKFILGRSWCSMPLVMVLVLLACANIAFHAAAHHLIPVSPLQAVEAGLLFVVLIEMIVGGRVVPGFSTNAAPGVWRWRPTWLHRGSFMLAAAAFLADSFHVPGPLTGTLALLAGAAVAVQAIGWNPLAARSNPMQWILHAAYAWIPIGLVLLGLASFGIVPRSAAIHALAVGSMGGLIIGMITRTALGHSGRLVRAGRVEVTAFILVLLAAALRVAASLIPPFYLAGMLAAGTAWTAAFTLYVVSYGPTLLGKSPPADDVPVPLNRPRSIGVQP
ncbi:MAG: NnrS family protein [Phycisphaerales bacterium]|nr:NnrS family protein [Planctomycetota bacterium]